MPKSRAVGPAEEIEHDDGYYHEDGPEAEPGQQEMVRVESAAEYVHYRLVMPGDGQMSIKEAQARGMIHPWVKIAIGQWVRGKGITTIAREMDHDIETLRRAVKMYHDLVADMVEAAVDPLRPVRALMPQAVETVRELLEKADMDTVRQRSAQMVWEHTLGKPETKGEHTIKLELPNITIVGIPGAMERIRAAETKVIDIPSQTDGSGE